MNLKGKISISRTHGGDESLPIRIEVTDELSGARFLCAKMTLADFASVLTGLGGLPCDMDIHGLSVLGKVQEHKNMEVWVPDGPYNKRNETAAMALVPHEVDGWKGCISDATNHHRLIKREQARGLFRVGFTRHVDKI
jgi:hypothetical protein